MYCKQIYSDKSRKVFDLVVLLSQEEINFIEKQLYQKNDGLKNIKIENEQIEIFKEAEVDWNPIIGSHLLEIVMNCKGLVGSL
ncbi:MAG: hypothetical protein Tsb0014_33250 [Pleurocapsa sp.]